MVLVWQVRNILMSGREVGKVHRTKRNELRDKDVATCKTEIWGEGNELLAWWTLNNLGVSTKVGNF